MIFKVLRGFLVVFFAAACAQHQADTGTKGGISGAGNADSAAEAGAAAETEVEGKVEVEDKVEEVMAAAEETAEERATAEPAPPPDSFTLFFEPDSWILGTEAQAIIDDAVAAAALTGAQAFAIDAYADGTGGKRQNDRMSRLRAEAVADELILRGITGDRMQVTAHGESAPAAETAGDKPEQAKRQATITLK